MKSIKCKNTKPEMSVRRELHKRGYRYRANDYRLPGRPDIVLPKHNAIIFINGCYWHAHDCDLFSIPKTRRDFWLKKFSDNVARDAKNTLSLIEMGWRVGVVWECSIRESANHYDASKIINEIENWLASTSQQIEFRKEEVNSRITDFTEGNVIPLFKEAI